MALAVSTGTTKGRSNDFWGTRRVSLFRVTGDNSYPTGGWAFDPKAQGHQGKVETVLLFPRIVAATGATTAAGRLFMYDYTAKKIVAYQQKDPAAAGGADIPLPQVANGTDLSTVVLDVLVLSD